MANLMFPNPYRNDPFSGLRDLPSLFPEYSDMRRPSIAEKLIDTLISRVEPMRVDEDDDATVIHVGDDASADDIVIDLSDDAQTLNITVEKVTENRSMKMHRKITLNGDKVFDVDALEARLEGGDIILIAPVKEVKPVSEDSEKLVINRSPAEKPVAEKPESKPAAKAAGKTAGASKAPSKRPATKKSSTE